MTEKLVAQISHPIVNIYNFIKEDHVNSQMSRENVFTRYILWPSGKVWSEEEFCLCRDLNKSSGNSLVELLEHAPYSFDSLTYVRYWCYQKYQIPNCALCRHYQLVADDMKMLCSLHEEFDVSSEGKMDTLRAKECPGFEIDEAKMNGILDSGKQELLAIL